ncbi:MAG: carbohydrate ABC transporter permease [Lachnospiraceae bacterium]|nr:carbohydrate ABC transporter permease [Lachnospiraceae bacterium]MBP5183783.1 carbohydrate ABC transporter permease [Lachnospiraceae bacterium]
MNENSYRVKMTVKNVFIRIFLFLLIAGLCFTILYPILSLVPTVFSAIEDIGNPNVIWLPEKFSTLSFTAAIRLVMPNGLMTIGKTVLYAAGMMVLQVFFSAMVGYSMARVKSVFSKIAYFLVIFVFLTPRQSLLLAQYINFKHFDVLGIMNLFTQAGEVDLINKPIALVMLAVFCFGVNQSLFIFLFAQFFKNIPKELEEAANIDGCGFVGTYFRIMLPNAIPIISTVAILSFVWNYGDTYFTNYFSPNAGFMSTLLSTTFVSANKNFILNALQNWYGIPTLNDFAFDAVKQAGVLIYLIPLIIVYLIGQRKLVQNMENSGLVG